MGRGSWVKGREVPEGLDLNPAEHHLSSLGRLCSRDQNEAWTCPRKALFASQSLLQIFLVEAFPSINTHNIYTDVSIHTYIHLLTILRHKYVYTYMYTLITYIRQELPDLQVPDVSAFGAGTTPGCRCPAKKRNQGKGSGFRF